MKNKRILSLFLCLAMAAVLPWSATFGVNADTSEQTAIQNLITAWQGLSREARELWAVPRTENQIATTPAILTAMNRTAEQIGPYYMDLTVSSSNDLFTFPYVPAGGAGSYAPLSKYSNITFCFQGYTSDLGAWTSVNTDHGKFEFQFNNANVGYPTSWSTFSGSQSFTSSTSNAAAYFTGTAVTSIKLLPNGSPPVLRLGCIIGTYTQTVLLPDGYASMSAQALIDAAQAVDISGYDAGQIQAFENALTALRAFTPSGVVYNNLISAWQGMSREVTELWAVPRPSGDNRQTATADTATAMGVDLDKIGPYYSQVTWNGTDNYQLLMAYRNSSSPDNPPAAPGKYTSVFFMAQALDASGNPLNTTSGIEIMFGYNNNNPTTSTWKTINASTTKIVIDPTTQSGAFAAYFNETVTVLSTCQLKANAGQTPAALRVGCFFGVYNEYASLPAGAVTMTLDELVAAADAFDTAGYNPEQVQAFESALADAKAFGADFDPIKNHLLKITVLTSGTADFIRSDINADNAVDILDLLELKARTSIPE
ncbi:MAG: hypothetical protein LBQ48_05170 [Oscillospiraceae bacterium]|jgi:hypothetical protein|nr:hypothetical protein [Oscillospiraceae bacterium]